MSALEAFMSEYKQEGPPASHANHFNQAPEEDDRSSEPEMMEEEAYKPVSRKIRRGNLTKPQAPRNQPDGHSRLMDAFKAELTSQLSAVRSVGKTEESIELLFDWYGVAADKLTAEMEQSSAAMETSEYDKISKQFNRFMGQQSTRVNRIANQ